MYRLCWAYLGVYFEPTNWTKNCIVMMLIMCAFGPSCCFFHFFGEYVDKFLKNATQTRPQISLNQMQTKMHWAQCKLYWAHASCIESNALCIHFFALFWLFTSHFNYSFQTLARLVKIGAPFSQEFGVPCWVCEPVLSPSLSWPDLKHTFGQPSFEKKTTSWN